MIWILAFRIFLEEYQTFCYVFPSKRELVWEEKILAPLTRKLLSLLSIYNFKNYKTPFLRGYNNSYPKDMNEAFKKVNLTNIVFKFYNYKRVYLYFKRTKRSRTHYSKASYSINPTFN